MKITIEDIKKSALSKIGSSRSGVLDSSPADDSRDHDTSKLASQLRHIASTSASDDLAMSYLNMIKEAHFKARKKLGISNRLSLR